MTGGAQHRFIADGGRGLEQHEEGRERQDDQHPGSDADRPAERHRGQVAAEQPVAQRHRALQQLSDRRDASGDAEALAGFHHEAAHHRAGDDQEDVGAERGEQQRHVRSRHDTEQEPAARRQAGGEQHVVTSSRSEEREGVGQDAGDRLDVPRERHDQQERRQRLGAEVQLVLQQELQGQPTDDRGLGQRGDEGAQPHHDVVLPDREAGACARPPVSRARSRARRGRDRSESSSALGRSREHPNRPYDSPRVRSDRGAMRAEFLKESVGEVRPHRLRHAGLDDPAVGAFRRAARQLRLHGGVECSAARQRHGAPAGGLGPLLHGGQPITSAERLGEMV